MTSEPVFTLAPADAFEKAPSSPLVFASPHSGDLYPADMGARDGLSRESLRSAEDLAVDRMVGSGALHGVPMIAGRIGRAYLDLNRGADELDPLLTRPGRSGRAVSVRAKAGYGVVPRLSGDGRALYDRSLSRDEVEARIQRVHAPYHDALAHLMRAARDRFGFALLIDWHSMPSRAARLDGRPVDVVLGDRHGVACAPMVRRLMFEAFQQAGWRTALNQPYAGGYSTRIWGRPDDGFHAIQVEINRALYADEAMLEPGLGFAAAQAVVSAVIARLLAHDWSSESLSPG